MKIGNLITLIILKIQNAPINISLMLWITCLLSTVLSKLGYLIYDNMVTIPEVFQCPDSEEANSTACMDVIFE